MSTYSSTQRIVSRNIISNSFTAPIEPSVECKMDADCSSKLACFSGSCRNPCIETKPCGANAECSVVDTLPLRTMTCLCLPGYLGDADVECKRGKEKLEILRAIYNKMRKDVLQSNGLLIPFLMISGCSLLTLNFPNSFNSNISLY